MSTPTETSARILALDIAAVAFFVALGRDTHDEGLDPTGILETSAPFLIGLAVAWAVAGARHTPISRRTGVIVPIVTVIAGMALRRVAFDEGTAASFVIVASAFLFSAMAGWRVVVRRLTKESPVSLGTPDRP